MQGEIEIYLPGSGVRSDTTSVWAFPRPVQEAACAFRKSIVQKEIKSWPLVQSWKCHAMQLVFESWSWQVRGNLTRTRIYQYIYMYPPQTTHQHLIISQLHRSPGSTAAVSLSLFWTRAPPSHPRLEKAPQIWLTSATPSTAKSSL